MQPRSSRKGEAGSSRESVLARRIGTEHAALEVRIRAVEAELALFHTASVPDVRRLLRFVSSFDKHLRRHFAFEEEGGPFDELGRDREVASAVAAASVRHVELETALGRLLRGLAARTPPSKLRVVHALNGFLRELRDHEQEEEELFAAFTLPRE